MRGPNYYKSKDRHRDTPKRREAVRVANERARARKRGLIPEFHKPVIQMKAVTLDSLGRPIGQSYHQLLKKSGLKIDPYFV